MYTETEYQKKIIAAKNDLRLRCIVRRSFAVVFFGWVFVNYINFGFAQTKNTTVEGNSKNNNVRKINVQKPQPEAKYHIVYHTKNLVPLPFNNTRFKPVYTGTISPEDSEKTRKAMTMMLEKSISSNPLTKMVSSSKFYLKEQKQKDREKHKREIKSIMKGIIRNSMNILNAYNKNDLTLQTTAVGISITQVTTKIFKLPPVVNLI